MEVVTRVVAVVVAEGICTYIPNMQSGWNSLIEPRLKARYTIPGSVKTVRFLPFVKVECELNLLDFHRRHEIL